MTISPLPQPYTQTFASSTTCGRKHRKRGDQLHLNEDRCGEFTVKLNTGELVRAFYVLDGHGETIPKHPHSTFSSHGQRYVNLVQVLLPTVLTTLLDSALSASPSDMDPLVTHLSLFHEEIDTRAQAVNPNLCVENGSTALLSFILRDTLYVLSVGDSAALLMHEGVPVRVWRRCGIQEDGGVCSWPDSVDGFPNVTKEGQTFEHLNHDFCEVSESIIGTRDNHYRLLSKTSGYSLAMINSLGNMGHKSVMLSRTNVYAFYLPTLFQLLHHPANNATPAPFPPGITLLLCTDGAKDELTSREITRLVHDPRAGIAALAGIDLGPDHADDVVATNALVSACNDIVCRNGGTYAPHEVRNAEAKRAVVRAVRTRRACMAAEGAGAEAMKEEEKMRMLLECGCEAVVAAAVLMGTDDDVTCVAVAITQTGSGTPVVGMVGAGVWEGRGEGIGEEDGGVDNGWVGSADELTETWFERMDATPDTEVSPSPIASPVVGYRMDAVENELGRRYETMHDLFSDDDSHEDEDDEEDDEDHHLNYLFSHVYDEKEEIGSSLLTSETSGRVSPLLWRHEDADVEENVDVEVGWEEESEEQEEVRNQHNIQGEENKEPAGEFDVLTWSNTLANRVVVVGDIEARAGDGKAVRRELKRVSWAEGVKSGDESDLSSDYDLDNDVDIWEEDEGGIGEEEIEESVEEDEDDLAELDRTIDAEDDAEHLDSPAGADNETHDSELPTTNHFLIEPLPFPDILHAVETNTTLLLPSSPPQSPAHLAAACESSARLLPLPALPVAEDPNVGPRVMIDHRASIESLASSSSDLVCGGVLPPLCDVDRGHMESNTVSPVSDGVDGERGVSQSRVKRVRLMDPDEDDDAVSVFGGRNEDDETMWSAQDDDTVDGMIEKAKKIMKVAVEAKVGQRGLKRKAEDD